LNPSPSYTYWVIMFRVRIRVRVRVRVRRQLGPTLLFILKSPAVYMIYSVRLSSSVRVLLAGGF
jgi:hypothetical protein